MSATEGFCTHEGNSTLTPGKSALLEGVMGGQFCQDVVERVGALGAHDTLAAVLLALRELGGIHSEE